MAAQFTSEGTTLSGVDLELVGSGYRMSLVKRRFATGTPAPAAAYSGVQTLPGPEAHPLLLPGCGDVGEASGVFGKVGGGWALETQDGRCWWGGLVRASVGGIEGPLWGILARTQGRQPEATLPPPSSGHH